MLLLLNFLLVGANVIIFFQAFLVSQFFFLRCHNNFLSGVTNQKITLLLSGADLAIQVFGEEGEIRNKSQSCSLTMASNKNTHLLLSFSHIFTFYLERFLVNLKNGSQFECPLFSYRRILFIIGTWLDPISVLNICVQCLPGAYDQVTNYLDMVIFFLKKNIVGPQEAQDPRFWLPWTMTHYILRSTFFWAHPTPLYG